MNNWIFNRILTIDHGLKDNFTEDFPPEFGCLLSDNKLTFWFTKFLVNHVRLFFQNLNFTEFCLPFQMLTSNQIAWIWIKAQFSLADTKTNKNKKIGGKNLPWEFKKEKWSNFRFLFSTFKERRFHWPRVCNFHSTISLRHRNSRGWSFWRHGRPHRGQAGEQQTFIPPRIRTLSPQPQSHRGIQKET